MCQVNGYNVVTNIMLIFEMLTLSVLLAGVGQRDGVMEGFKMASPTFICTGGMVCLL